MVVDKKIYPKQRSIRLDDDVMNMFKDISDEEGRNYNKMLAILLANYLKQKEESENGRYKVD